MQYRTQLEAWAPENAGAHAKPLPILSTRRTTRKALLLLFVRPVKMSRVVNSLVTGHTGTTNSAHFFAWVGTAHACGAAPTRGVLTCDGGGVTSVSILIGALQKLCVRGIRDSSHIVKGPTRKTPVFCLFSSVKAWSSLTHSHSGGQRPIHPIFLLTAWGSHSPRWWVGARPRCALRIATLPPRSLSYCLFFASF